MARNQAEDAQNLYEHRAPKYDDSWHVRFARHMAELAELKPGEHVLDLACGTGLVSYPASTAVGSSGSVIGVDITSGMLAQAEGKKPNHELKNVAFYQHSITELETLEVIKGKQFDVITCASAFVLLPNPGEALKQWTTYLRPGGRLLVDVTHPQNLISGTIFERVGNALGKPMPSYRLRFQKHEDLQKMMQAAELESVEVKSIRQQNIDGTDELKDYLVADGSESRIWQEWDANEGGRIFDEQIDQTWTRSFAEPAELRKEARRLFVEEWERAANEKGKVQGIDEVFVGIGWKPK